MADDKQEGTEPKSIDLAVDARDLALTVIGVAAVVFMLQYAEPVCIPIVLGILISYALDPLVRGFQRLRLPRAIGAALAVTLFVGAIGAGVYTLSDEAMSIVSSVPQAAKRVGERLRAHRRHRDSALQMMQRAASEIDRAAQEAAQSAPQGLRPSDTPASPQRVEIVQPPFRATDYLWWGGVGLVGFTGQFVMIMFLVYFLLVTGDLFKRKLVKIAGPHLWHKRITVHILDDINAQIGRFIRAQVLANLIVAVVTGLVLWAFGVNQFIMWGLLAGVFNSVPYLGPVLVTGGLGVVTFMQFDDLLKTVYICGATLAVTTLEGFLLTPALMGRAARMNPVAIFIGLLFWSWIWGIWGTVLAVPMLMMLKAICDHVEDLQAVGELLGE